MGRNEDTARSGLLGIRHAALAVTDLPRALEFYTRRLGFARYHVTDEDWAMVQANGTTLSLVPARLPPAADGGSHPAHLGIVMDTRAAVDALHGRLRRDGGSAPAEPRAHRDGSYGFYLSDPEGNQLEIIFIPHEATTQTVDEAVVLLASAPAGVEGRAPFERLLALAREHSPRREWELAFAGAAPTLAEAVGRIVGRGKMKRAAVVPVLFGDGAAGRHDEPVSEAQARYPGLTLRLLPPVDQRAAFREGMLTGIFAALA